jgi:hypothetical protein
MEMSHINTIKSATNAGEAQDDDQNMIIASANNLQ